MIRNPLKRPAIWLSIAVHLFSAAQGVCGDGVFVRFRLHKPGDAKYFVELGGHIHQPNWYIARAVVPPDADKRPELRVAAGEFTPWFDLATHAGADLHTRKNLAGGIAEFPNVTAKFVTEPVS